MDCVSYGGMKEMHTSMATYACVNMSPVFWILDTISLCKFISSAMTSLLSLPKLLLFSPTLSWLRRSLPRPHQGGRANIFLRRTQSSGAVRSLTPVFGKPTSHPPSLSYQLGSSLAVTALGQAGSLAGFATEMASRGTQEARNNPVVSVQWLHDHLKDENIKVLDASWYMPNDKRNPLEEFKASHIPGALFFDVDGVVDPTSDLPHMLPSESAFAVAASALGIRNGDTIVVYDGKGIFSAARVWWMFRVFGHENVAVLDGGLPEWAASGYKTESSVSEDLLSRIQTAPEAVRKTHHGEQVDLSGFKPCFQPHLVWSLEEVKKNILEQTHQHIDARSKARFDGVAPEPRKGIRGGHVPGSMCIPFGDVLKDGRTLMNADELEAKFKEAGISFSAPVVASCGTGITACVLALALHRLGKEDVAVYDGSWTEWGGVPDTPVATAASASSS